MIFLIILSVFKILMFCVIIVPMLYAPLGVYRTLVKQEPTDNELLVPGLILWVLFGIRACHEIEMRNCENIEEIEVTCCVDYEYGRSGQQCIEDGICTKKVCID
tara:strand:+ start:3936 stop:4247 length:312 start_codon:yes stop_codon:yes gene_type:complete